MGGAGAGGGAKGSANASGSVGGGGARERLRATAAMVVVAPIRLYQLLISPLLGQRCRYYPSCSEYAVQAVRRYGILRGLVLAGWRLLRCNPWSAGGVDLVEDQRLFARPGGSAGT
jgi:putative membrane protein insertion efficiency factor